MTYLSELPHAVDKTWVDGITNSSDETIIYITIAGPWHSELLEALDCIYLDNKRKFELIQIKKQPRFVGACIAMKHELIEREETKISYSKKDHDLAGTRENNDEEIPVQEA